MPNQSRDKEAAVRAKAYSIWEREGRPEGQARDHWQQAVSEARAEENRQASDMEDEEKILAGRLDVNIPALLTRDVAGG